MGGSTHICPADIPVDIYELCESQFLLIHNELRCSQISRSDFIYDENLKELYFLEINTHPGFTPTSLAPEQALKKGISYEDLCVMLVEDAFNRKC